MNLNNLQVHKSKDGKTLFVPLPRALWREAYTCSCSHCKGAVACWDTLALAADGTGATWTVHAPELHKKGAL